MLSAIEIRPREKKHSIKTKSDLPKQPKEKRIIKIAKQQFIKTVSTEEQPRQEQSQDKPAAKAADTTIQTANLSARRTVAFVRWGTAKSKRQRQATRERELETGAPILEADPVQPPSAQQRMKQAAVSEYREQRQKAGVEPYAVQWAEHTATVKMPEQYVVEKARTAPEVSNPVDRYERPVIKKRTQKTAEPKQKSATNISAVKLKQYIKQTVDKAPQIPAEARRLYRPAQSKIEISAQKQMKRYSQKKLIQKAKNTEKVAGRMSKKIAAATVRTVKKLIGALAGIIGGSTLLVMLCGIIMVAAVASSPFGIFFSGEQGAENTISPSSAIAQINSEYAARLEEAQAGNYDSVQQSVQTPNWRNVLAVFACKTAGTDDGTDVTAFDPERVELLRTVFWDMTSISTSVETIEHPDENPEDSVDESWIERILHITVTSRTTEEMANQYNFTNDQRTQLAQLLSAENNDYWREMLYGIGATDGEIVAVALSQVGNVGGQPYWSWYGFHSRVAWCACFVSWCADQCGYIDAGIIPKFSYCPTGVQWFQGRGQWQSRGIVPEPGWIVFFDWGGDGISDHVGIVENCDGAYVHTIEGNTSGDVCKQNTYTVGYSGILGYGVPAY